MSSGRASDRVSRRAPSTAPLFAALGDPHRLTLVSKLSARSPQSISELSRGANITRQGITKHLALLEQAGVVRSVREGRRKLFAFTPTCLDDIQVFLERVSAQWDQALARLKAFVEE